MPLLTNSQLASYTDKLAIAYERLLAASGSSAGSVQAGTWRNLSTNLAAVLLGSNDLDQAVTLGANTSRLLGASNVESVLNLAATPWLNSLNNLCQQFGPLVNAGITSLPTYLSYYNGGLGGAKFSSLLHPSFGKAWLAVMGTALPPAGLFHPGIHPALNPASYPLGFGTCTYSGTFAAGASASALYSEPLPFVEVTTTFTGGSAHPVVTVTGTDDTGLAAQTWTADLGANNPAAPLSTTLSGATTADSKGSVAVASSAGFSVGNVVVVGAGTVNQETAVVLAIADGTHLTLELRQPHGNGETVTGNLAVALTPGVSGRRIRSVSGITISGGGGWTAGAVRAVGGQQRMGDPVS